MKRVLMLALVLLWACTCLSLAETQAVKQNDKPDDRIGIAIMKEGSHWVKLRANPDGE
jgi:hypothetical protein